jgi:hypothetical protein
MVGEEVARVLRSGRERVVGSPERPKKSETSPSAPTFAPECSERMPLLGMR